MAQTGGAPAAIVTRDGLAVERDEGALAATIDEILAANPAEVAAFRGGKAKLMSFFVGQVLRATRGKADPKLANQLLRDKLNQEGA